MTKQEFMAMSQPHKLAVLINTEKWFEKREPFIATLIGIFDFEYLTVKYVVANAGLVLDEPDTTYTSNNGDFTPICRPLSDLTKEIEHNGEKFVPIVELAKMRSSIVENVIPRAFEAIKRDIKSKRLPFDMVLKLIEWKFDIANLIESGEAIDVNTLETNPYK